MKQLPQIPDYIAPFIAYRTWHWGARGLESLNRTQWPVCKKLTASSSSCNHQDSLMAPMDNCSCGIYAAKNLQHLYSIKYIGQENNYGVHGEVYLWGKIFDHQLGYRAQHAYPKNLVMAFNGPMPWRVREIETRLKLLTQYRVDIFLQPTLSDDRILLWSEETGFNPRAFETPKFTEMLEARAKYVEPKKVELQVGDTVAVKNVGIGIVRKITEDAHIAMFNVQLHVIPMTLLKFNRKYYRWEASSPGRVMGL